MLQGTLAEIGPTFHNARMTTWQRWTLITGVIAGLGLVAWLNWAQLEARLAPFMDAGNWQQWRVWIRSFGPLAPIASILISVVQIIPLPIPAPTIPLANGWLFGVWGGTAITWIGVTINGFLGYALARGPGRRLFLRFVSGDQLERAERAITRHGAAAVLIARLIPILPFSAISVAAGLLDMRPREYVIATAIGVLPSAWALALIGYQLSKGDLDWFEVGLGVGVLVVLGIASIPVTHRLEALKR